MPYSLPQPSNLDDIFKMNPGAFMQGQQFMGGGVQQNEADLKKAQLANLFDEQSNPLRVQEQQLANQQREFQLPGMQADSSMRVRKNANEAELNDETMKAARTAFAQKATQAHLDELEAKGQEMAYSSDPAIAAQGQKILMAHKDIIRDRAKQEEMTKKEQARIKLQGEETRRTNEALIAAGKFAPKGSGKTRDPILSVMLENDPVKKYTGLLGLAKQAEQEGDEDAQAGFLEQAKAIEAVAQAKLQAAGTPAYTVGAEGKIVASPRSSNVPLNTPQVTTQRGAAKEQAMADLAAGAQFSSPEVEAQVRKFAGPASKAPQKPVTEAEYNALPKGATYLHPDGRMKVKK